MSPGKKIIHNSSNSSQVKNIKFISPKMLFSISKLNGYVPSCSWFVPSPTKMALTIKPNLS